MYNRSLRPGTVTERALSPMQSERESESESQRGESDGGCNEVMEDEGRPMEWFVWDKEMGIEFDGKPV